VKPASESVGQPPKRRRAPSTYDAFGLIGNTFRELDWKTIIFFERASR
jgi:hypothetical protein